MPSNWKFLKCLVVTCWESFVDYWKWVFLESDWTSVRGPLPALLLLTLLRGTKQAVSAKNRCTGQNFARAAVGSAAQNTMHTEQAPNLVIVCFQGVSAHSLRRSDELPRSHAMAADEN